MDKREEFVTRAVEKFLRNKGTPHVLVRAKTFDGIAGYELEIGRTRPHLEGMPPPRIVFITRGLGMSHKGTSTGYFAAIRDSAASDAYEKDNVHGIEGIIKFHDLSRPHEGVVYVRSGKESWYPHLRIELPNESYAFVMKNPEKDLKKAPKKTPKKIPEKKLEKNRTFKSVGDLRSALQKGEFVR